MKLDSYLRTIGGPAPTTWARSKKLNPTMILRILDEIGDATGENWARIWYATNGKVCPWDYFDARGRRKGG